MLRSIHYALVYLSNYIKIAATTQKWWVHEKFMILTFFSVAYLLVKLYRQVS